MGRNFSCGLQKFNFFHTTKHWNHHNIMRKYNTILITYYYFQNSVFKTFDLKLFSTYFISLFVFFFSIINNIFESHNVLLFTEITINYYINSQRNTCDNYYYIFIMETCNRMCTYINNRKEYPFWFNVMFSPEPNLFWLIICE